MADRKRPELPPIVPEDSIGREPLMSSKTASGQFLTVDETKRPRANSDPFGLHFAISILPEITVTTDDGVENGSNEDDEVDNFLVPPAPRPRSNTCPDDMFQQRKERPPTPPPTDIVKSPVNRKINRFNFSHITKEHHNGISFIHHKLSKVSEDGSNTFTPNNRLNGHRRHSTGRRASCLASLSESSSLLEEEENENEVLTPAPIILSHSMNSLSLSNMDPSGLPCKEGENNLDDGQSGNNNCENNNKSPPVLIKCSVGLENNKDCESNGHDVVTSNSSIR